MSALRTMVHESGSLGPMSQLCDCADCWRPLHRLVDGLTDLELCLRTTYDTIIVSAAFASESIRRDGSLEALFYVPNDELKVALVIPLELLRPPRRWLSFAWLEDSIGGHPTAQAKTAAGALLSTAQRHH